VEVDAHNFYCLIVCGANVVNIRVSEVTKCVDLTWNDPSISSVQWVLESIPPLVNKLELEAVTSLASKNKWSYIHKSQVPGHLGDLILHGGV